MKKICLLIFALILSVAGYSQLISGMDGPVGPTGPTGAPATPGAAAYGEMYLSSGTDTTTLTSANAYYRILDGFSSGDLNGFTFDAVHDALIATTAGYYHLTANVSFVGTPNKVFTYGISKNGASPGTDLDIVTETRSVTQIVNAAITGIISLSVGDSVFLVSKSSTAGNYIVVNHTSVTLSAVAGATGATGATGASVITSFTTDVSSAELLALNGTPKTIVAAPAAGYINQLTSIQVSLDYGGVAYAIGTTNNFVIKYKDGTGPSCTTMLLTTGFFDATADKIAIMQLVDIFAVSDATNFEAQPIIATIGFAGNLTTGTGTLHIHGTYITIPTGL